MVFFIIVTYNSTKHIAKCLSSIREFEPSSKIIIVDNKSKDDTLDLVREFSDIVIFENNQNLGFGKANNIGIKHAIDLGADYVYLLNHDAYLVEPVIEKIKFSFKQNADCGIISPLQLGQDECSLEENFSKFLFEDGVLSKLVNDGVLMKKNTDIYFTNFMQAASWMIKVDVINRVGLFNPLFFHYGEDNEYLNRMKYHGVKVGILTNCKVVHISNPLNLTHMKNFDVYHRNRVFSSWLVSQLDINIPNNKFLLARSLLPHIKGLLYMFFTFRFNQAIGRSLLLLKMLTVIYLILPSRKINVKERFI